MGFAAAGPGPFVHLVNPSHVSFGVAVITPRWLYVLAAATGTKWGDPVIVDETLDRIDPTTISAGDVVGIGIHTGNALRGYEIGRMARERGAWVVFGGIHATLFPDEPHEYGGAHAVVRGDGDLIWASVVEDCFNGRPARTYEGGRIDGDPVRLGAVGSAAGGPLHVGVGADGPRLPQALLVLLGLAHRRPGAAAAQVDRVVQEVVELRRGGFRFIALADDNFYPVTFDDLAQARRRSDPTRLHELEALRQERFDLMARLAQLPDDMVFYTQITMEAAEDPEFLDAMRQRAHPRRARRRRIGDRRRA